MAVSSSRWRREPFRLFFPLGMLLSWVGVGHWLLYTADVTATYSWLFHGRVQMQTFVVAFALGFLLTAIPRRTQSPPPGTGVLAVAGGALLATTVAAVAERWLLVQLGYLASLATVAPFALRGWRQIGAGRRPPAAFVLIPSGTAQGALGAALIAASTWSGAPSWSSPIGRLLVDQGVFLCLVIGVGGLLIPLIWGAPPPPDFAASPEERRRVVAYAAAGGLLFVTFVLEALGWERAAPLARAVIVALGLGIGAGAWRRPRHPGLNRRLIWLSCWLIPLGLAGSGLAPDYRIAMLHVTYVGGFGLLVVSVATHVALGHLGLERVRDGRPPAVAVTGIAILAAMAARIAADASHTYFEHLGWAAAAWMIGSAVWLGFLGPKLLRH